MPKELLSFPYFETFKNAEVIKVNFGEVTKGKLPPKTPQGKALQIRFLSTAKDDRCPKETKCIQSGSVEINVELKLGPKTQMVTFTIMGTSSYDENSEEYKTKWGFVPITPDKGNTREWNGYTFYLVALFPYPEADKSISQDDYVATFFVNKAEPIGK